SLQAVELTGQREWAGQGIRLRRCNLARARGSTAHPSWYTCLCQPTSAERRTSGPSRRRLQLCLRRLRAPHWTASIRAALLIRGASARTATPSSGSVIYVAMADTVVSAVVRPRSTPDRRRKSSKHHSRLCCDGTALYVIR